MAKKFFLIVLSIVIVSLYTCIRKQYRIDNDTSFFWERDGHDVKITLTDRLYGELGYFRVKKDYSVFIVKKDSIFHLWSSSGAISSVSDSVLFKVYNGKFTIEKDDIRNDIDSIFLKQFFTQRIDDNGKIHWDIGDFPYASISTEDGYVYTSDSKKSSNPY